MNYYFIQNSLGKDIGLKYPQVQSVINNCDIYNEPKFIDNFIHKKIIDFTPCISYAKLYDSSKLTDLVSVSSIGFSHVLLISGRLKIILEKYNNDDFQLFQSKVFHKNKEYADYWVLNMYKFNNESIDYENSEIKLMSGIFDELEIIKFQNYEEFDKKNTEVEIKGYPLNLAIDKVKICKNVEKDFFMIKNASSGLYIVSEKLKKEIEDTQITGIEFQPTEVTYKEWKFKGGLREKIYGKV